MFEKFEKSNKLALLKAAIQNIDFENADIPLKEQQLYRSLLKVTNKTPNLEPIGELAEPFNIDELTSDNFNTILEHLKLYLKRNDSLYTNLAELNNTINVELEAVEKTLQKASNAVQDLTLVSELDPNKFYWVSDSFNDTSLIDFTNTDALVDSDFGGVLLKPASMENVEISDIKLDHENIQGIPGCNLLILNINAKNSPTDSEPQPVYEKAESKSLVNLLDRDPLTYFEIERNFIPPVQKLIRQGRSFVFSEGSGVEEDVVKATKDLDWRAFIDWGDGRVDKGPDNKGVSMAEFVNLDISNNTSGLRYKDSKCKLSFDVNFATPSELSSFRMLPFVRNNEKITLKNLEAFTGSEWFPVAKDLVLGGPTPTSRTQQEILRRTGTQSTGVLIPIPSNLPITKLRVSLESDPAPTRFGFAHPYKEVFLNIRTDRTTFGIRSVDKRKRWERRPLTEEVIALKVEQKSSRLWGSITDLARGITIGNNIFQNVQQARNTSAIQNANIRPNSLVSGPGGGIGAQAQAAAQFGQAIQAAKIGGTLGQVGGFLASAAPYAIGLMALDTIVGGLFGAKKTVKVEREINGFDIFRGHRAAIGLRGVDALRTTFEEESIIQSVKRSFPQPVSKITLFAEEEIPGSWPDGTYITYQVSVDGSTWIDIQNSRNKNLNNSITLAQPSIDIIFRARLRRFDQSIHHSPKLKHYTLQGLPA